MCLKEPADVSQGQKSPAKCSVILQKQANCIIHEILFKCIKMYLPVTLEPFDPFQLKMLNRSVFSLFSF